MPDEATLRLDANGKTGREATFSLPVQEAGSLVGSATIDGMVRAIVERFSPEKVILFGSYACGEPTPDSDVDLLVIMATDLPRHKRAVPLRMLFRPMPCAVDFFVYAPSEVAKWNGTTNHLVTEALRTGRVLHERR